MSTAALDEAAKYVQGLKRSSEANWIGFCPLHGEEPGKSKPSFSFNEDTGQWYCYSGCGGGGFGYLLKKLGKPRESIDRAMARLKPFLTDAARKKSATQAAGLGKATYPLPERLLGLWEKCPSGLLEAGFSEDVLWEHDVGFDEARNRVTWPVRDIEGTLAGIVGRNLDPGPLVGKYKTYKEEIRELGFPGYEMQKSHFLWRMDRVYPRLLHGDGKEPLLITEGYKACLWQVQHGFPNTVALQTASMSERQAIQVERLGAPVILCLDNNLAGWKGTAKIGYRLRGCIVHVMTYPDQAQQSDDLSPSQLRDSIHKAAAYSYWRRRHELPLDGVPAQRPG